MNTASISYETEQSAPIGDQVVAFLRRRPDGVIFPELIQHLDDLGFPTHGAATLHDPQRNVVLWGGVSPAVVTLLRDLWAAGRIAVTPTSFSTYGQANRVLAGYKLARRPPIGGYAKTRWLPSLVTLPAQPKRQQRGAARIAVSCAANTPPDAPLARSLWPRLRPGSIVRIDHTNRRLGRANAYVGEVIEADELTVLLTIWSGEDAGRWRPRPRVRRLSWATIGRVWVWFEAAIAGSDAEAKLADCSTRDLLAMALPLAACRRNFPQSSMKNGVFLMSGVELDEVFAEVRRRERLDPEAVRT